MRDSGVTVDLGTLLSAAMRVWATNPWLPGLIIREVLAPDGPLRSMFVRGVPRAPRAAGGKLVRDGMERGQLRSDLDPRLTVLSMISLGLFPFLALPVTSKVFGGASGRGVSAATHPAHFGCSGARHSPAKESE